MNAPALHFAQSSRNVTAQLHGLEIGPAREQLRSSSKTGRAHARAGRQVVQILSARLPIDHKHIARVFTLELRDNLQTVRRLGRQIFQRVNRAVDLPLRQSNLELVRE